MTISERSRLGALAVLAAVAATAADSPADAGTVSATIAVSASIAAQCSITASPLNFATAYTQAANDDAQTTISTTCASTNTPFVTIDNGLNGANAAAGTTRSMKNTTAGVPAANNKLGYDVFTDAPGGTVWSSSATTASAAAPAVNKAGTSTLTVFGRIPAGQAAAAAGTYTDTLNVTVNF